MGGEGKGREGVSGWGGEGKGKGKEGGWESGEGRVRRGGSKESREWVERALTVVLRQALVVGVDCSCRCSMSTGSAPWG